MKSKLIIRRMIVALMSIMFLAVFAVFYIMLLETRKMLEREIGLSAQTIAVCTATKIMDNIEEYEEFLNDRDIYSSYYQRMQAYLASIKSSGNLKYIYTLNLVDEAIVEYILDAEPIGSIHYSPPGFIEEDEIAKEEYRKIFSGTLPTHTPPTSWESWGYIISGYAPIYNSSGQIIGVVGADIDETSLMQRFNVLFVTVAITFIMLFVVLFYILNKMLPFLLKPMLKDKLTGAYNRRYYEDVIKEELPKLLKHPNTVAVMMLDLDKFKKVNDTYGHPFGDVVLTHTANLIMTSLRNHDYFIRYGGEEFMVILTKANKDRAKEVAEHIRKSIEKTPIYNLEKDRDINTTISIGIAIAKRPKMEIDELVIQADIALYEAKVKRNDIVIFKKRKTED